MLGNFIYSRTKDLFEEQLNAGNVLDEAVVFIEDTKQIWNHGTYFDCSVASEIFEEYKKNTQQSINGKVDKVSGKQLSTEDFTTALKTRLEGLNVYRHTFNDLSGLPDSGDGWYSIIDLGDMEAAFVQISSGQSDTQVAVSAGWGGNDRGSLVVLNTTIDVNNNYAHIKAVRIRRHKANNNDANGYLMLEAKLNRTGYGSSYKNTVVSVFTSADHNPIVINNDTPNVLQLNSSTSETLLQEFELQDKTIMAKSINVETITATNLSTVATSGNYNDLKNKPTIPEAYNDTSLREALNQKANKSELFSKNYNDLTNKPTIPAAVTENTVSDWGFTKVTKVTWDSTSNMNDFKTPGVYEIYGERTVKTDNLPITNDGSGNSIAAKLTVVASTLQPANNEICVTQFLQLSNRVGGEGTTYVRTYNENNNGMNGWSPWQKQMGMIETLINGDDVTVGQEIFSSYAPKIGNGLNGMTDNGMYSGIYLNNIVYTGTSDYYYLTATPTFVETFVLIVINDYAASGKLGRERHITQLKYAVNAMTGQSTVKKRRGSGDENISWRDWEDADVSQTILWNASSNMNDYRTAGTYEIYGERTKQDDNLPIFNASSGHSVAGRLQVIASTLKPANEEICVTQFLMLSNRQGGDGNMYVRTYNENNSPFADGWTPWQKLQGIREGYIFTNSRQINPDNGVQQIEGVTGIDNMVDNGMYSGIYVDDGYFDGRPSFIETFTIIVINNYAVVRNYAGLKRTISQLKYAVDALTNKATIKIRTKTDGDATWSDWSDIGGGNTYLNPNDYLSPNYLSKLGVGTFEFSGALGHDDVVESIWRYIFEDLNIQYSQFNMKVVIDSSSSATATIMGCGKYDIVTFNPSNNSDVVSILNSSAANASIL